MPFWRRFGTPLLTIASLIGLSILAVVFIGEGFRRDGIRRDRMKLRKRDGSTIIFDMPWNFNSEWKLRKDIKDTRVKGLEGGGGGGLQSAVEGVADLLFGGGNGCRDGCGVAGDVQGEAEALTETVMSVSVGIECASSISLATTSTFSILGGQTEISSALAEATSAVNEATGVVGGIVNAGSTIVASVVAGALNDSSVGGSSMERSMASGTSRQSSTTSEPQEFVPPTGLSTTWRNSSSVTASLFNGTAAPLLSSTSVGFLPQTGICTTGENSSSITALSFNITADPALSSKSVFPMATNGTSKPTSTSTTCPLPITETCTVTETWHSTYYAETATYFSFISALTVTCTETVSVRPSLTACLPPSTTLPMQSSLVACAVGIFAKRAEDCPGEVTSSLVYTSIADSNATPTNTSIICSNTTPVFNSIPCPSIPSLHTGASQTSSHPCPNAGYSCSECPDGWFCPPSQTVPQSAPCGFGWACGACSGGWFCIPSPTNSGSGPVKSVASLLSEVSVIVTQATSTAASFTAQPPCLASGLSMAQTTARFLTMTCVDRLRDCSDGILGATSSLVPNPALSDVSSALAQVSGLIGGLLSTVLADVASALQVANNLPGNLQPAAASTSIVDDGGGDFLSGFSTVVMNTIQNTGEVNTPAAAGDIISTAVSIAGNDGIGGNGARGNIVPTASAAAGNVAGLVGTNAGGLIAVADSTIGNAPGLIAKARAGERTISYMVTLADGQSTVREVVTTALNGIHTAVGVRDGVVNGGTEELGKVGKVVGWDGMTEG